MDDLDDLNSDDEYDDLKMCHHESGDRWGTQSLMHTIICLMQKTAGKIEIIEIFFAVFY